MSASRTGTDGRRPRRASSIHLLPRKTDVAVAEAIDAAVVSCSMTGKDALAALNEKLASMSAGPIAKSSWWRFIGRMEEGGIPARWQLVSEEESADGETVTISRTRYIALLEAESALLRKARGQ